MKHTLFALLLLIPLAASAGPPRACSQNAHTLQACIATYGGDAIDPVSRAPLQTLLDQEVAREFFQITQKSVRYVPAASMPYCTDSRNNMYVCAQVFGSGARLPLWKSGSAPKIIDVWNSWNDTYWNRQHWCWDHPIERFPFTRNWNNNVRDALHLWYWCGEKKPEWKWAT